MLVLKRASMSWKQIRYMVIFPSTEAMIRSFDDGHIGDAHVAQGLDVALSLCTQDPKQVALQDMMGNIYSVRVEPSSTIRLAQWT